MKKYLLAAALNLTAVAVPAAGLVVTFGNERVNPDSPAHLLWLGGAGVFAFIAGSIGARIASKGVLSPFDVLEITIKEDPRLNRRGP